MSKSQQVKFGFVVDRSDPSVPVTKLKTIQLANGRRETVGPVFAFVEENQNVENHRQLMQMTSVKTALNGIAKERNPFITLSQPVLEEYLHDDLNPKFKDQLLDELTEALPEHSILNGSMSFSSQTEQLLAQQVASLTRQLEMRNKRKDLNDLVKKFSLQPFTNKGDGRIFMRTFEEECLKYDIVQSNEKVDALKSFCKDTALSWWNASRVKLSVENWAVWKSTFLCVFGPKTFREARMAYGYVYKFGSFRDYAIEKEQRLLELDSTLPESARIDGVVVGLPLYIQDELKRDELKTMNQLLMELTHLNPKPNQSSYSKRSSGNWRDEPKSEPKGERKFEKEPCSLCALMGYEGRFHTAAKCRNKSKAEEMIKRGQQKPFKVNLHEAEDDSVSESSESADSSGSSSTEKSHRSSRSGGTRRSDKARSGYQSGN